MSDVLDTKTAGVGDDPWTLTLSGPMYYLRPTIGMIGSIENIAQALSNQGRFHGQTSEYYSVAQHSVLVAGLAERMLRGEGMEYTPVEYHSQILACLLHDSAEAWVGDMSSPLKQLLGQRFKEIELSILKLIFEKYDLDFGYYNKVVKMCDRKALEIERYFLLPECEGWPKMSTESLPITHLIPSTPVRAKQTFLTNFNSIRRKLAVFEKEERDAQQ